MTQMNYAQAVEYMQELATESEKETQSLGIDMQELSNALLVVPVTGSKGKSSILTYVDAIYAYMKIKVCICHLRFYRNVEDCILMNGKSIPKTRLAEYVSRLQEQTQDKRITFGRAIQTIAYWYACDKECKLLFVESDAKQEAIEISEITGIKRGVRKQSFSYRGYQKLEIAMKGTFQIENAARAVEFVEHLAQNQEYAGKSLVVHENAIRKGLAEAVWEGSLYQVGTKPLCIQDMANDAESVEVLISYLKRERPEKPWILLMAMEKESNWWAYTKDLCESAMMTITITAPYMNRREVYSAYELAQELSAYTDRITAADSIEEALELGGMLAGGEGILVCFGTHTVPGEVSRITAMKTHRVSDTHGI